MLLAWDFLVLLGGVQDCKCMPPRVAWLSVPLGRGWWVLDVLANALRRHSLRRWRRRRQRQRREWLTAARPLAVDPELLRPPKREEGESSQE